MVGTLHRPSHIHQTPRRCHPPRQPTDRPSIHLSNLTRPLRRLRNPVRLTHHISPDPLKPHAVLTQKRLIMQVLADKRMHHPQHESHIRIGPQRYPLRVDVLRHIIPYRTDANELHTLVLRQRLPVPLVVTPQAILGHLGILGRQSAKHHHQLRILSNHRPRSARPGNRLQAPDHPRQDHAGSPKGVVGHVAHTPAKAIEEPRQLPLRAVKSTRAPPTGRRIKRLVPIGILDPLQLTSQQIKRLLPRHLHHRLHSPLGGVTPMPLLQPAPPHHGMRYACLGVDRARHRIRQRARTGIALEGPCTHYPSILHLNIKDAPVVASVVTLRFGGGHVHPLKVSSDSKPLLPDNNNRAREVPCSVAF